MKASCSKAINIYYLTWQIGKVPGPEVRKSGFVIYCISHFLLFISKAPGASGSLFIKKTQMRLVAFGALSSETLLSN